jgi:RimK family alpha-L-glutamate ligase
MKGYILINAYSDNEDYLYQAHRLREEFSARGVEAEIVRNGCGIVSIGKDGKSTLAIRADFVVYLDKDKYTARLLEKGGVRLFNRAESIFTCDDKMVTHIALADNGIPMPESVPAPFCYTPSAAIAEEECRAIEEKLSLPVVVKCSYGSLGKEVFLAKDRAELSALADKLRFTPHFYQKYIAESKGKDLRVIAVGGCAISGMVRTSRGDFRSNMALGGSGEPFVLTEEVRVLAKKIAEILKLDYCGIDLLFGKDGFTVCEVNSNAYFGGTERVTGINIAAAYAEHIIACVKAGH